LAADPEEALYGALMEALGYAVNRKPFRELARAVPLAILRPLSGEPAGTRLLAILALLTRAAGMLRFIQPPEQAIQLKRMLKHLPATPTLAAGRWHLFRVRPANHPVRRIAGAAHLVDRYIGAGLVRGLEADVMQGRARLLVQKLAVRPLIGAGRARAVAVNVVLPFMHALGTDRKDGELRARCLELYRAFPSLEDNEITREMKRVLSPESEMTEFTGARRHQGLIHLYRIMTGRIKLTV
jgi:hypothetical protein